MTLVITALAAALATAAYLRLPVARAGHVGALALMYVGASLMWCVDGLAALVEGEPFVELADAAVVADDALLGICVVALGLAAWGAINLAGAWRARSATA